MTLKVAVPNKGSLSEDAISIFRDAGYRQRHDSRDLALMDPENEVEFYYLRPRDIATYIASGELDVGVTGRDLVLDANTQVREILPLDFGKSTFVFAAEASLVDSGKISTAQLNGKRIATAYPGIVARYLSDSKIAADVVALDGAVEGAIKLGLAEVIADVVATGSTLKRSGLKVFGDPVLSSEAILVARTGKDASTEEEILVRRLASVVIARQYVLMDYDVEEGLLTQACAITPGLESPTVSPLQRSGWLAVRAMVKRKEVHSVMDELYQLGARGILVTDIHSCRL